MRHARRLMLPLLLATTAVLHAGDAADPADAARAEVETLRRQLANVTLELRAAQRQIQEIRDFLEERDLAATFDRWQATREALAEQRRSIRRERVRLEAARDALDRTTRRIAEEQAQAQRQAEQRVREATAPDWTAQYQLGVIYKDGDELFVKVTDGSVLVDSDQDIDRRNVLVRGTFLNRSVAAWRYTFAIRAGGVERFGRPRRIVGAWRYQTPLLQPGQLHEFEVKMPVEDVSRVRVLQIGNVHADRPADGENAGRTVVESDRRHGETVDAANRY